MTDDQQIIALGAIRPAQPVEDQARHSPSQAPNQHPPAQVTFDRHELATILNLYGTKVAAGEWRDYAMDFNKDRAVFAVFRRTSEQPLYRIEKAPRLARKQGAYTVTASGGLILRRGHDLGQVLKVLLKKPKLVSA
ncbi:MAG: DUF2794 domain-containing protein [Anderseniella sp.]